jgi:predicted permease
VLLALQVALSLVLLVGAGLFGRSLYNVRGVDLGFDSERVLFVRADVTPEQMPAAERRALLTRLFERARTLPQVERAAFTRSVPFYMTWGEDLFVPGIDSVSKLGEFSANAVSPDYFATVGTRILRGRGITDADREGGQQVVVVDEAMARTLWPGADPIGRCMRVGADTAPCAAVVGVSQDVRRDDFDAPAMEYYLASAQRSEPPSGLFLRTRGDARAVAESLRRELQRVAPGDIYIAARPLQDIVDPGLRPWRLGATMFSVFGALALLIAAVGLYGVIAFNVTQRTHELGVRMALGARGRDILRLIVGEGVRVTLVGIAVGTAVALLVGRFAAPLLFRVSPRDPLTMLGVALTLLAVAVVASVVPARRAARTDPNLALRAE